MKSSNVFHLETAHYVETAQRIIAFFAADNRYESKINESSLNKDEVEDKEYNRQP